MQTSVAFGWLSERSGEKTFPAAGLAQSVERLTAGRKIAGSIPGAEPILRALNNWEGILLALRQAARFSLGSAGWPRKVASRLQLGT